MPKQTFFNLPDDKRDRIVELAIEEFSQRSYADASISRIVERAGIAKGSFYQYFEDKLDLFRWLMLDLATQRKIAFFAGRPLPEAQGMFSFLENMLVAGIQFGMANPRLARIADMAFHRTPPPELAPIVTEGEAMSRAYMRAMVERAAEAGELRAGIDVALAADFMQVVLRHSLDVAMRRRFGFDMWELCMNPEQAPTLSEADIRGLAAELVDLLRSGIGSGKAPDPDRPTVNLADLQTAIDGARERR